MSFQAYIDNIKAKTGKSPEDFRDLAVKSGILKADMKAGDLIVWLKNEHSLGHGHCMALWAVFVQKGWVDAKSSKLNKRG
jgi:Domain of unknown function (DUF4287)